MAAAPSRLLARRAGDAVREGRSAGSPRTRRSTSAFGDLRVHRGGRAAGAVDALSRHRLSRTTRSRRSRRRPLRRADHQGAAADRAGTAELRARLRARAGQARRGRGRRHRDDRGRGSAAASRQARTAASSRGTSSRGQYTFNIRANGLQARHLPGDGPPWRGSAGATRGVRPQPGAFGPQPGQPGPFGPQPGQPGAFGPQLGQPGPFGPQPGQPGAFGPQPGPFGPQPGQPGAFGPQPGQPGAFGPQPGQPGPFGPQPGPFGPQPGQPGAFGPQPGQPGPFGPQPGQPGPSVRSRAGLALRRARRSRRGRRSWTSTAPSRRCPRRATSSDTVKDAESGDAVAGATIRLVDAAGREQTATADGSGDFRFPDLPAGAVTLKAEAQGYMNHVDQADVRTSEDNARRHHDEQAAEDLAREGAGQRDQDLAAESTSRPTRRRSSATPTR